MVSDKSDQHQTVYDNYDVELAAKYMQLLVLGNASNSLTGQLEYNVSNEDEKHCLYQMFVAHYCEGCSATPLTQYKNNEIIQALIKEKYYFGDERFWWKIIYWYERSKGYTDELEKLTRDDGGVTITIKLKQAAAKKWGWGLSSILRLNIGMLAQIKAI